VQRREITERRSAVATRPFLVRRLLRSTAVASLATAIGRLRALLLANVALQLLDGWVTLVGTSRGFGEGNPLVSAAMSSVGPAEGIFATKLIALGFLYLLYCRGTHPFVEPGLASLAVTYTVFAVLPWTVLLAGPPPG